MRKRNQPGCRCCGCTTGAVHVTVLGCNSTGVSGVGLTLKLGSTTIATGTTDGTGQYTFTGLNAGTYTVVYGSVSRFVTASNSTAVVTCGHTTSVGKTLAPATGYVCTTCCGTPLKATLQVTIGSNTIACTSPGGNYPWAGSITLTTSPGCYTTFSVYLSCGSGSWNLAINGRVSCSGSSAGFMCDYMLYTDDENGPDPSASVLSGGVCSIPTSATGTSQVGIFLSGTGCSVYSIALPSALASQSVTVSE